VAAAGYDENEEKEAATCRGWRRWLWVAVGRHGQWMAVERQLPLSDVMMLKYSDRCWI